MEMTIGERELFNALRSELEGILIALREQRKRLAEAQGADGKEVSYVQRNGQS